jgi:serine phosphatase RsbU (regulator of sigma subunit)
MSGHAYLNQIVNVQKIYSPDLILTELHNNIIRTLQKNETQNRDGMDAVICVIDKINHQIEFSGAKNPLVYIKNSEISIIKGNKESVGEGVLSVHFEKHTIPTDREAMYYIFSDGYEDQFGGAFGRKILRKNFYELLKKVHQEPLDIQKNKLADYFMDWKGTGMQIDDVLLIGFKVEQ